jgi:hypothetical protein
MKPRPVLLDTEFTHTDSPNLISLGMVSPCGREYYVELTDSWSLDECSLFVLGQVLPQLDEGAAEGVLRSRLGDLYELLRWLTAESFDERKRLLTTSALQKAIVREFSLAHDWEQDTGLGDLRAGDVPRLAEALAGLKSAELTKGKAGRTRRQAARELAAWLSRFPDGVRIIADSPLDNDLVLKLLRASQAFPEGITFELLSEHMLSPKPDKAILTKINAAREAYFQTGGRRHHALDDSRGHAIWWNMAILLNALSRTEE